MHVKKLFLKVSMNQDHVVNDVVENVKEVAMETNRIYVHDDGFVIVDFTFILDVLSQELQLFEQPDESNTFWGLAVTSKTTKDPIVGIVISDLANLEKCLASLNEKPGTLLQFNETTIIAEPYTAEDGSKSINMLQSLNVRNNIVPHNIAKIEYYQLDKNEVIGLLGTHNRIVKEKMEEKDVA